MEVLTADEAARMLGVSRRQLARIVETGLLVCRDGGYDPNDVSALKEIRKQKLDLADVAAMAQRAHMEAFRARRELKVLKDIIGYNLPTISLDADAVYSLHTAAENASLQQTPFLPEEIVDWSRIFLALGEEYFEAVTLHLRIPEPWWVYLDLAGVLLRSVSLKERKLNIEVRTAYDYLASARPSLRHAAFSRAHQVYGKRNSLKMFPDMLGKGHQSVLQIMNSIEDAKQRRIRG